MPQEQAQHGHPGNIYILVAASDGNVRSALRCAAEQNKGVCSIAEVSNSCELRERISSDCPDILLLDWELSGGHLAEILSEPKISDPCLIVVALSSRPECRGEALEAGALYFIVKGDPPEHLLQTIKRAADSCRINR